MTENKRFVKEKSMPNKFVSCIMDNEKYLNYGELENTLNALHEENQALKLRLEFIEAHNKALIHTNDELKKDLRKYDKLLELEYWREK